MPAQQVFSLEEVNALVPELTRIVGRQLELRASIEHMLDELAETTGARGRFSVHQFKRMRRPDSSMRRRPENPSSSWW